mmetsp:Transcript_19638/g.24045  ORF Transcript_19638/g.24045 Transcript_19638/m.24045 type:complete len:204 (-) Transcript_19638:709-1320(-)
MPVRPSTSRERTLTVGPSWAMTPGVRIDSSLEPWMTPVHLVKANFVTAQLLASRHCSVGSSMMISFLISVPERSRLRMTPLPTFLKTSVSATPVCCDIAGLLRLRSRATLYIVWPPDFFTSNRPASVIWISAMWFVSKKRTLIRMSRYPPAGEASKAGSSLFLMRKTFKTSHLFVHIHLSTSHTVHSVRHMIVVRAISVMRVN